MDIESFSVCSRKRQNALWVLLAIKFVLSLNRAHKIFSFLLLLFIITRANTAFPEDVTGAINQYDCTFISNSGGFYIGNCGPGGITVKLFDASGTTLVATTTTDYPIPYCGIMGCTDGGGGIYGFSNVIPGNYKVFFEGAVNGYENSWYNGKSDVASATLVTVGPAETVSLNDVILQQSAYSLHVDKFGTGSGTVTSNQSGINCGTICTANFANGDSVTLTVTTSADSAFTGWTNHCSGFAPCILSMTTDKSVGAGFGLGPKARIEYTGYGSLRDAYEAAGTNATILLVGENLYEVLTMNQVKNVILKGGYTSDFVTSAAGATIIKGLISVQNGSLRIEGVKVRP